MNLKYSIDQRPPMRHLLIYGLQWLVLSIPNVLTVAILGKLQFSGDVAMQTLYLQKVYIVLGLTMLAQAFWGHRMPLVVGPAAVLIVGILSSASEGFNAVYTAIATGGAALLILSLSGLLGKVARIFTPRVIITILGLIAMTLAPVIIGLVFRSGDGAFGYLFFILSIIAAFLLDHWLKGVGKSLTVVILTAGATAAYFAIKGAPETPAAIGLPAMSSWFVRPEFNASVILSFLVCFFALLINELGSIESVKNVAGAADKDGKRLKRGCSAIGLGNMLAGSLGVIGPVDFSISPGIIASTRCASRFTIVPCGVGLVLCACFPSAVAWLTRLPDMVIGIVLGYIIILQLAAAFNMMFSSRAVRSFDHALTIAIPLCAALIVSLAPPEATAAFPPFLRPVLSNGFVVGVLLVVFFEHLVFSERGR